MADRSPAWESSDKGSVFESVSHRFASMMEKAKMRPRRHSDSPTILLRVSDGTYHTHRSFNDFSQATQSAEAYAGAGFSVEMISATGRYLMGFEPRRHKEAV
jgi:hypothetical protein